MSMGDVPRLASEEKAEQQLRAYALRLAVDVAAHGYYDHDSAVRCIGHAEEFIRYIRDGEFRDADPDTFR